MSLGHMLTCSISGSSSRSNSSRCASITKCSCNVVSDVVSAVMYLISDSAAMVNGFTL